MLRFVAVAPCFSYKPKCRILHCNMRHFTLCFVAFYIAKGRKWQSRSTLTALVFGR